MIRDSIKHHDLHMEILQKVYEIDWNNILGSILEDMGTSNCPSYESVKQIQLLIKETQC